MVTRVGMIGLSKNNGHPFSFSAIINGFCEEGMKSAGWPVIHEYLLQHGDEEYGIGDMQVTHAWTQDPSVTAALCRAVKIRHNVKRPEEMLTKVDAVIIARDDAASHWLMARPFLEAGVPVFIDKPLALEMKHLTSMLPYLEKGQLMSCSGMRYAKELDELHENLSEYGEFKLVRGTIVNDWERYGIHMLEAIVSLLPSRPVSIGAIPTGNETLLIRLEDGTPVIIDALGEVPGIFDIDVIGTRKIQRYSLRDNFTMFRRMLQDFHHMVSHQHPPISPDETFSIVKTLIAGRQALQTGREVDLRMNGT